MAGENPDGLGKASEAPKLGENCMWADAAMSMEFLAGIIDHIAHPIFVKDREFRFVLLNRALCAMVGHRRENMLGKTDYDFFPKEEADFFREKDRLMFSTGAEVTIEEEFITDADAKRHVLTTTKVPLRSAAGDVTHLVGIIHDITRLKVAEDALRLSNVELEQRVIERTAELAAAQDELVRKERLAVLGRLAGGLAHQIRNPLAAIMNAAYVLKRVVARTAEPEMDRAVAIIQEEVWFANQIITDLLDYARVRQALPRATDVRDLIEQTLASCAIAPEISVHLDLPNLPLVAVDAEQVRGAIDNLVRNAVDAMPDGGQLTIVGRVDGTDVVVGVLDTGSGVSAQVRDRLFEPLVTTKPLGLGLGLTTARALIENQGGSLAFVGGTAPGTTRFDVRLPGTK